MALTGTDRGAGADNSAGTTYTFSPASTIAAGSTAVLGLATDNAGASGAAPWTDTAGQGVVSIVITDDAGNIWKVWNGKTQTPGSASNDGVSVGWWDSLLTTQLTTSSLITVTFNTSVTAKAYVLHQLDAAAGMAAHYISSSDNAASGASTTPSTTANETIGTNTMIIGIMGAEYGNGTITGDSDVLGGSWTTQQKASVGTTTTGVEIASQRKLLTSAVQPVYNNVITSTDWASIVAGYSEGPLYAFNRGNGSRNTGGESTYAITPTSNFVSNTLAVLCLVCDNSAASGLSPLTATCVTDSLGNTWSQVSTQNRTAASAANDGCTTAMYQAPMGTPLTTSDTITVTFSTTTVARAYILYMIVGIPGYYPVLTTNINTNSGSSTTPTVTSLASVPANQIVIGMMGAEQGDGTISGGVDSTGGIWDGGSNPHVGTTTAGVELSANFKQTVGAASQVCSRTITSTDWATIIVAWSGSAIPMPKGLLFNQAPNRASTY